MRTLIIYHAVKPGIDCPDGISAAWVARQKFPEADLLPHSYGEDLPDVSEYNALVIVDYSFKKDVLEMWRSQGKAITVIDHHKTALNDLSEFSGAIFDMKESGATLAWKHFFPETPVPAYLQYVKDRDLWEFELPYTEEIYEAIANNGRSLKQIDEYVKLSQDQLIKLFAPKGAALLQPKRIRVEELAQSAFLVFVKGFGAIACEIPEAEGRLSSDLASFLYRNHPEENFAVILTHYLDREPNGWGLSFRSDKKGNNFDVSAIAKLFGGGGHHNAAGAFIPDPRLSLSQVVDKLDT